MNRRTFLKRAAGSALLPIAFQWRGNPVSTEEEVAAVTSLKGETGYDTVEGSVPPTVTLFDGGVLRNAAIRGVRVQIVGDHAQVKNDTFIESPPLDVRGEYAKLAGLHFIWRRAAP